MGLFTSKDKGGAPKNESAEEEIKRLTLENLRLENEKLKNNGIAKKTKKSSGCLVAVGLFALALAGIKSVNEAAQEKIFEEEQAKLRLDNALKSAQASQEEQQAPTPMIKEQPSTKAGDGSENEQTGGFKPNPIPVERHKVLGDYVERANTDLAGLGSKRRLPGLYLEEDWINHKFIKLDIDKNFKVELKTNGKVSKILRANVFVALANKDEEALNHAEVLAVIGSYTITNKTAAAREKELQGLAKKISGLINEGLAEGAADAQKRQGVIKKSTKYKGKTYTLELIMSNSNPAYTIIAE